MRAILVAGMVGLAGCSISEPRFPTAYADATCEAAFECHPEVASESYADERDCTEELTAFLEDVYSDLPDDCTYQVDLATQCVRAVRAADCDDELAAADEEACSKVYLCE